MPVNVGLGRSIEIARGIAGDMRQTRQLYQNMVDTQRQFAIAEQERKQAQAFAAMNAIEKEANDLTWVKKTVEEVGVNGYNDRIRDKLVNYNTYAQIAGAPLKDYIGIDPFAVWCENYHKAELSVDEAAANGGDTDFVIRNFYNNNKYLSDLCGYDVNNLIFQNNAAVVANKELAAAGDKPAAAPETSPEPSEPAGSVAGQPPLTTGANPPGEQQKAEVPTEISSAEIAKSYETNSNKQLATLVGGTEQSFDITGLSGLYARAAMGRANTQLKQDMMNMSVMGTSDLSAYVGRVWVNGKWSKEDWTPEAADECVNFAIKQAWNYLTEGQRAFATSPEGHAQLMKACSASPTLMNAMNNWRREDRMSQTDARNAAAKAYDILFNKLSFKKGESAEVITNTVSGIINNMYSNYMIAPETEEDAEEFAAAVIAYNISNSEWTDKDILDMKKTLASIASTEANTENVKARTAAQRIVNKSLEMLNNLKIEDLVMKIAIAQQQLAGVYNPSGAVNKIVRDPEGNSTITYNNIQYQVDPKKSKVFVVDSTTGKPTGSGVDFKKAVDILAKKGYAVDTDILAQMAVDGRLDEINSLTPEELTGEVSGRATASFVGRYNTEFKKAHNWNSEVPKSSGKYNRQVTVTFPGGRVETATQDWINDTIAKFAPNLANLPSNDVNKGVIRNWLVTNAGVAPGDAWQAANQYMYERDKNRNRK